MARSVFLVSFLTAGAYATRVATQHEENANHLNEYLPLVGVGPSAILVPPSLQMQGTRVGNNRSPGISMQAPEYLPDLPEDWLRTFESSVGDLPDISIEDIQKNKEEEEVLITDAFAGLRGPQAQKTGTFSASESEQVLPADWRNDRPPGYPPDPSDISVDDIQMAFYPSENEEQKQALGTFAEYAEAGDCTPEECTPPKVDDIIIGIIKEWTEEAKREAAEVWEIEMADTQETTWKDKMANTQKILGLMRSRIAEQGLRQPTGLQTGSTIFSQDDVRAENLREKRIRFQPEDGNVLAPADQRVHVFGLAYQDYDFSDQRLRAESVQALATVQYSYIEDDSGFLYSLGRGFGGDDVMLTGAGGGYMGQYEAVNVNEVIATPFMSALVDSRPNAVGELLYAIIDWAAFIGKMVTIWPDTPEEEELYLSLGFEFFGEIYETGSQMVYALQIPTPKMTSGAGILLDLAD